MTAFLKIPLNDPTLKDLTCSEVMVLCWLENWCEGLQQKVCRLPVSKILKQLPAKVSHRNFWRILGSLQDKGLVSLTSASGKASTIRLTADLVVSDPCQDGTGEINDPCQDGTGTRAKMAQDPCQDGTRHSYKEIKKEEGERSPPGSLQNTRLAGGYGASADPGASAERKPESRPKQPDPRVEQAWKDFKLGDL